jgi:hypothetical protein
LRIYGSIQIAFWENSDIQKLSDQSKLLAIYLLTGPHSNMLGCFRLPVGYITEDLKWDKKITKSAFNQLSEMYFLTRDVLSSWVVIHDFLRWNPIQNPRQGVGIQKLFNAVPIQSEVVQPLINGLFSYGKYLDQGFVDRLHTLKKMTETLFEDCVADKEQNQNQDQDNKSLLGKSDIYHSFDNGREKIFQSQANSGWLILGVTQKSRRGVF